MRKYTLHQESVKQEENKGDKGLKLGAEQSKGNNDIPETKDNKASTKLTDVQDESEDNTENTNLVVEEDLQSEKPLIESEKGKGNLHIEKESTDEQLDST